jgi:hypothetical protein
MKSPRVGKGETMSANLIGTTLQVEFIEDTYKGRTGIKAKNRVGGRYSFPSRAGSQPAPGDIWEVEVEAENPSGSVYFLRCIQRMSTLAERQAADAAACQARQEVYAQHVAMRDAVQAWLNSFDQWSPQSHTFELEGVEMVLRTDGGFHKCEEGGVVITLTPQVEYLENTSTFDKVEVVIPWAELSVESVGLADHQLVSATLQTDFGRREAHFAPYAGTVQFLLWERAETVLNGLFHIELNGVEEEVTAKVAEFTVSRGEGRVTWFDSAFSRGEDRKAFHYLPEVPAEERQWVESLQTAHDSYGARMQQAGLLGFVEQSSISNKLVAFFKELGYGGIGFFPGSGNAESYVLHPTLAPLVEGLPKGTLEPARLRAGFEEEVWATITWENGPEPPSQEEIAHLIAETRQEWVEIDVQEWLGEYGEDTPLSCEIVCVDFEKPYESYVGACPQYLFHAVTEGRFLVKTYRKNVFGAYGWKLQPALSEQVVTKPGGHTFEEVAKGNVFFEGVASLQLVQRRIRKVWYWVPTWEAPETQEEETARKVEAIREVIRYGREYRTILTGWRWTEADNPVVYACYGDTWVPLEFDRGTYALTRHKGFGSKKGDIWLQDVPTPRRIGEALRTYDEYGWAVAPERGWQDKAGRSILSIFPDEFLKAIEGGA